MKIPEYKLRWLEKQLMLYDELEKEVFEYFDFICAAMVDRYLQDNQALAEEPLAMFLKQYANETMRAYESDAHLTFDASVHDMGDCILCAVWCMDMLHAYDKWREEQKKS